MWRGGLSVLVGCGLESSKWCQRDEGEGMARRWRRWECKNVTAGWLRENGRELFGGSTGGSDGLCEELVSRGNIKHIRLHPLGDKSQ